MAAELTAIKAQRILTPLQDLRDAVIIIEGERIRAIGGAASTAIPEGARVIDAGARLVVPGFVDLHHHGALGFYASDGAEAVKRIAHYQAQTGTTGWLPTVNKLPALAGIVAAKKEGTGGTDVVGIHLEGPFLAPKRLPGQEVVDRDLCPPSVELFGQLLEAAQGELRLIGIAPELPGALELFSEVRRAGVVGAIAHTKGTYEQFMRAVEAGARHVTHTFNVMTGLHHRRPGVVGGALTCDQVTVELIADGYHVSPVAMDVLLRCRGASSVCMITDNVPLAGLPDGEYEFFGRSIIKKDGVSRLSGSSPDQDNTMAGSEWPMNHNIHNLVSVVGASLRDAIRMATLTPATVIGIDRRKGSLEPGKDADLVIIDEDVHIYLTMVRGQVVYQNGVDVPRLALPG